MTDTKPNLRPLAKLLRIPVEHVELFGNEAADRDEPLESEGVVRMDGGGLEVPVSGFAELMGITHQRANQLADEGVVVRTRHGHCDFAESYQRLTAFRIEDIRRTNRNGRVSDIRDAKYWAAQARNLALIGGADPPELRSVFRLIWRAIEEVQRHRESATTAETRKSLDAVATKLGEVVTQVNRVIDRTVEHQRFMQNRGALDFSGVYDTSHK